MTLLRLVPRWSSDGPQIPYIPDLRCQWSRIGLIYRFIDHCSPKRRPVQGLDTPAYSVPGMENSAYLLSIPTRLYTSVIVLKCEKCPSKVSCPTDMSPTTMFYPRVTACGTPRTGVGQGGVYPGWGGGRVREGAIPGTQDHPPRYPYSTIFSLKA